jgi:transcription elongation factor Elf1
MERTAECRVRLECPHCGQEQSPSVTALICSGSVPRETHACTECGKAFRTQATLDVDLEAVELTPES